MPAHLLTAAVAASGGALAWWLHVPLPWMLGAMAATGVLAWHDRAAVARPTRPAALLVLGLGLGQTFAPPVMAAVVAALPWLLGAAMLSILVGMALGPLFARLARVEGKTAYYASVPGGVVLMAVLAQRAGASVPQVTLAQTIRVVLVVATIPPLITWLVPHGDAGIFAVERVPVNALGFLALLAGGLAVAWAGVKAGLANPWLLCPSVLVMLLLLAGLLPSGIPGPALDAAQVGLGMALGQRLSRRVLLSARRLAMAAAATTLLTVVVMAALALALAGLSGLPVPAAVLGMAPGGMPEMAVTAKALELGVPLVLGFHLVRTLLGNFVIGPLWRLAERLGAR